MTILCIKVWPPKELRLLSLTPVCSRVCRGTRPTSSRKSVCWSVSEDSLPKCHILLVSWCYSTSLKSSVSFNSPKPNFSLIDAVCNMFKMRGVYKSSKSLHNWKYPFFFTVIRKLKSEWVHRVKCITCCIAISCFLNKKIIWPPPINGREWFAINFDRFLLRRRTFWDFSNILLWCWHDLR